MRWIAPRRIVRIDPDRSHSYALASRVDAGEPECPYALHLTDRDHRYRHVVFDLDVSREDETGVWRDADTLTEMLAEAGLRHMVVRSGPGGGIHVWVPVSAEHGMDPVEVARLARAAARRLPTLDTQPLTNPRTGAVRPPGAPHRTGGRAALLHPVDPADALSVCDTDANTPERFEALACAFGAQEMDAEEEAAAAVAAERIDPVAVRLRGTRNPMPDLVAHLLATGPGPDPSAHLARILPRLALARWSLADVRQLVVATALAPGWEHLRSRRFGAGRRPRSAADREALITRQWTKAVEFAAQLAPAVEAAERDLTGLRTLAAKILDAVADPGLWTLQAGPADARALLAVLLVALKAGQEEVDVDVRRVALAAGIGKSTAARALGRLRRDGRLVLVEAAEGTHAARHRLICPTDWPGHFPALEGGTQGNPAPYDSHTLQVPVPTREALLHRVQARLESAAHDVWSEYSRMHPRGLGRHVEFTYAVVTEHSTQLYNVDLERVVSGTGYSTATTARHLRILAHHGLIDPDTLTPVTPVSETLDAAAARLGTTGVAAMRERRYEAERAAHAAWCAEVARMRSPVALRARTHPGDRYARTKDGRPAHGVQITRHLVAA